MRHWLLWFSISQLEIFFLNFFQKFIISHRIDKCWALTTTNNSLWDDSDKIIKQNISFPIAGLLRKEKKQSWKIYFLIRPFLVQTSRQCHQTKGRCCPDMTAAIRATIHPETHVLFNLNTISSCLLLRMFDTIWLNSGQVLRTEK